MKAYCPQCRLDRQITLTPEILAEGEGKVLVFVSGVCETCGWAVLHGYKEFILLKRLDNKPPLEHMLEPSEMK